MSKPLPMAVLATLAWLGRGDFTAADYLEEGLSQLGIPI